MQHIIKTKLIYSWGIFLGICQQLLRVYFYQIILGVNIVSNAKHITQPEAKDYSVAALVLGIVSLLFAIVWLFGVLLGILAITFGLLSLKSAGRGKAIAGIVLGSLGIVLSFLIILIIFLTVPALQKASRDTARNNDIAVLATRITEYQTNNKGTLPAASSINSVGLAQIKTISTEGTATNTNAIYIAGKDCSGMFSDRSFSLYVQPEKSNTPICVGS